MTATSRYYYKYTILLLFFILGILTGWALRNASLKNNPIKPPSSNNAIEYKMSEQRLQSSYKFINPLLECDVNLENLVPIRKLQSSLTDYINKQESINIVTYVSVYFRDLNNGPSFGINSNELFAPASLLKVPLMIAYYKMAEDDPAILTTKVKNEVSNSNEIYNAQIFKASKQLEPNAEYTVDELIDRMIIYSDNVAYKILYDRMDPQKRDSIYSDLDIDMSAENTDPTGNIISIKDYSTFFRILYNASYLNAYNSEKALKLLSQSEFNKGLSAGLPNGVTIAHKFGERFYSNSSEGQLHECGIIYYKNNPYLLCVMTRGSDYNTLSKIISDISAATYSFLSVQWGN